MNQDRISLIKLCTDFMQNLRKLKGKYDPSIEENLHIFLTSLGQVVSDLKKDKNLRIHDAVTGGALRGDISSRKNKKELWNYKDQFVALCCDTENLKREVGFSRALFNSKTLMVIGPNEKEPKPFTIVSYESPLVRKKTDGATFHVSRNFAKCDLVAIADDLIAAVEVKTEPDKYDTCLPHALIEALAYGYFLSFLIRKDNIGKLNDEIRLCARHYRRQSDIREKLGYKVACYVAAPKSYFVEHFVASKKSQRWYDIRLSETKNIERVLKLPDFNHLSFRGYIVTSQSENDVLDINKYDIPWCIPELDHKESLAFHYFTIDDLTMALER